MTYNLLLAVILFYVWIGRCRGHDVALSYILVFVHLKVSPSLCGSVFEFRFLCIRDTSDAHWCDDMYSYSCSSVVINSVYLSLVSPVLRYSE